MRCEELQPEEAANEQLFTSKKLEGEAQQKQRRDSFKRLVCYDSVMGAMAVHSFGKNEENNG